MHDCRPEKEIYTNRKTTNFRKKVILHINVIFSVFQNVFVKKSHLRLFFDF